MSTRFVNGQYITDGSGLGTDPCSSCLDSHGRSNPITGTFRDYGRTWRMDVYQPGLSDVPLWQQLGYATKAAWKQAGRPGLLPGSPVVPPPSQNLPVVPVPGPQMNQPPATTGGGGFLSSVESAFSGIPTTYLLIGGAILAVMLLKKR